MQWPYGSSATNQQTASLRAAVSFRRMGLPYVLGGVSGAALGIFIFGFIMRKFVGWPAWSAAALGVGGALLSFVLTERSTGHPMAVRAFFYPVGGLIAYLGIRLVKPRAKSMAKQRAPIQTHPQRVRFTGEQDGPFESELKARLIPLLSGRTEIARAYLASVEMDGQGSVALCLRSVQGPNPGIVSDVAEIFASLFAASESVEVLFVDETREEELMRVCEPFFRAL